MEGSAIGRRAHNRDYLKWFLDDAYPSRMPGSPDPEQPMDQNKPGSRVILKGKAWDALLNLEARRAYHEIFRLIGKAEDASDLNRLACRYVLLNTNTSGGWQEYEKLRRQAGEGVPASRAIFSRCDAVVRSVLAGLDRMGLWLGWGFDAEVALRREAAADRRRAGVLASEEDAFRAIEAYYKLMRETDRTEAAAEVATMDHFDCSAWKVRVATKVYRDELKEEAS